MEFNEDLKSEFNSMDIDTLKNVTQRYERIADIAREVFEEKYASQGFPKYDELPPEIKEEILKHDPKRAQLVSQESKALTDRYMVEFCDQPLTAKERYRYFSSRPFSGTSPSSDLICIDNTVYLLRIFNDDSFTLTPHQNITFGESRRMDVYATETYYDIFSERHLCMKNNPNYARDETYKLFETLLHHPYYWRQYTVFLFLLNPANVIDKTAERHYSFSEPLTVSNASLLRDLKIKYGQ